MNNRSLIQAYERLHAEPNGSRKILLLESGATIVFQEMDYSGCDNKNFSAPHVWLYMNRKAVACVDIRSVTGVCVHPNPFK